MRKTVIITRHEAAIHFCASNFGGTYGNRGPWVHIPDGQGGENVIPVLATATAEDVTDAIVVGNVPLHLASLAHRVFTIEFSGTPPRGQEYDLAAMRAAGARLVPYKVLSGPAITALIEQIATIGESL